jgi:hypothetical protein
MMVVSYRLGQRHYRVPYAWKKLTAYVVISVLLFLAHRAFRQASPGMAWTHAGGVAGMLLFVAMVARIERRELAALRIPGFGNRRS